MALADRHNGVFPCRITHPDTDATEFHAPFFGAKVEKGDAFAVLLSNGQMISP